MWVILVLVIGLASPLQMNLVDTLKGQVSSFGTYGTSLSSTVVAIGEPTFSNNRGALYVFDVETRASLWNVTGVSTSSYFGISASATPSLVVGGAYLEGFVGMVRVFEAATGKSLWNATAPSNTRGFGFAVSASSSVVAVSALESPIGSSKGILFVYDLVGNLIWNSSSPDSLDLFGRAITASSTIVAVGAYGYPSGEELGAVYVFDALSGALMWNATGPGNGSRFGSDVSASSTVLAVGAITYPNSGFQGYVGVFNISSGESIWNATGVGLSDAFAVVSATSSFVAVGAPGENSNNGRVHIFDSGTGYSLQNFTSPTFVVAFGFKISCTLAHCVVGYNLGGSALLYSSASPASTASSASSALPSSSASAADPSSTDNFPLGALLGGAIGGGAGYVVFLLACGCLMLCCCCVLIATFFGLLCCLVAALILFAVIGVVTFSVVDGIVAFNVLSSRMRAKKDLSEGAGEAEAELDMETMARIASNVTEFATLNWGDIRFIRNLGTGAFGDVLLAEWNGVEVAVKKFKNASRETVQEFRHEALMMAKVSHHPNVVRFIGASFHEGSIAMVLGLCAGGTLLSALEQKRIDAENKARIVFEVAGALAFIHAMGIVHRDIASRNILLDGNMNARVADLGLSRVMDAHRDEQQTASYVGPVRWMAPECISERKYSTASDSYSFGVLLCEIWSDGEVPFKQYSSVADVAVAVVRSDARPAIPPSCPVEHRALITRLFEKDPRARPTMKEVHSIVSPTGADLLDGHENDESASSSEDNYVPAAEFN